MARTRHTGALSATSKRRHLSWSALLLCANSARHVIRIMKSLAQKIFALPLFTHLYTNACVRVCGTRVGEQGAVVVAVLESLGASKLATDPQLATTLLGISITSVASVATMCSGVRACVCALLSHR